MEKSRKSQPQRLGELISETLSNIRRRCAENPDNKDFSSVLVTNEFIERGKSDNGAWSRQQLRLLGVTEYPPSRGWKNRIIGTFITKRTTEAFLTLKDQHLNRSFKPNKNSGAFRAVKGYLSGKRNKRPRRSKWKASEKVLF